MSRFTQKSSDFNPKHNSNRIFTNSLLARIQSFCYQWCATVKDSLSPACYHMVKELSSGWLAEYTSIDRCKRFLGVKFCYFVPIKSGEVLLTVQKTNSV